MFSHIYLGANDLARAEAFYGPILDRLGWRPRFSDPVVSWAAWQPADADRPLLIIGRPYDGRPASPANGGMVALLSADRPTVDAVFARALEAEDAAHDQFLAFVAEQVATYECGGFGG